MYLLVLQVPTENVFNSIGPMPGLSLLLLYLRRAKIFLQHSSTSSHAIYSSSSVVAAEGLLLLLLVSDGLL